jgi:hypothetical protein
LGDQIKNRCGERELVDVQFRLVESKQERETIWEIIKKNLEEIGVGSILTSQEGIQWPLL